MKEWQGKNVDEYKVGSMTSKLKGSNDETEENDAQFETLRSQVSIEEYATIYIFQVIEFARRCFNMAARLAEEAVKKYKLKRQGKHDNADKDVDKETNTFGKELDDLQNKIIECNEECGLLLFNVLQEFSLMKEANLALFPHEMYSRLINDTLAYFRRGWAICESKEDAHEAHFRLQYMIGKTLRKRRWCELRQHERSDPEALSTANEIADSFSKAESARGEGDENILLFMPFMLFRRCELSSQSAIRHQCRRCAWFVVIFTKRRKKQTVEKVMMMIVSTLFLPKKSMHRTVLRKITMEYALARKLLRSVTLNVPALPRRMTF
ncbi:unnamed protein product [Peronospora destructor]|nr:unnamed protein product [Peronospora destructor]